MGGNLKKIVILSAIHDMSAIWDVRYWEVSLYFIQYSSVSIVDFEQVNVARDIRTSLILLLSFFLTGKKMSYRLSFEKYDF